jgi:hypothetical protein
MMVVNPYTKEDMPWIALDWNMEEWIDTDIGVENGMVIYLCMRNDAYWQDGNQITAKDVAWNFEFIESLTAPEYMQVWKPLIKTEIVDDFSIKLYINATGLWQFYIMVGSALTFPKVAWEDYMGDYDESTTTDYDAAVAYKPWEVLRSSKPGMVTTGPYAAPSGLTMLFGAGPYYFRYWDPLTGKGVVKVSKNPNYWARVNMRKTQTTIGIDGLLFGVQEYEYSDPMPPNYQTVVALRITLVNINMLNVYTISKHVLHYHWATNTYEDTTIQIELDPGEVHTEVIVPLDVFPLPKLVGDLGKRAGTPPSAKWFLYDNVVDGTDLALFLIAMKVGGPILFRLRIDNPLTSQEVEVFTIRADWQEPWWSW